MFIILIIIKPWKKIILCKQQTIKLILKITATVVNKEPNQTQTNCYPLIKILIHKWKYNLTVNKFKVTKIYKYLNVPQTTPIHLADPMLMIQIGLKKNKKNFSKSLKIRIKQNKDNLLILVKVQSYKNALLVKFFGS